MCQPALSQVKGQIKAQGGNTMSKMGEQPHLPSDKRVINRKAFRFVRDPKGNCIPVIHGSLDSKLGRINNKLFLELQRCGNDL